MFALSSLFDLVFGGFSFLPWSNALGYSNYSFAFYIFEDGCYAETAVQLSFLNAISHNRGNCNPFCLGNFFVPVLSSERFETWINKLLCQ
jgi:hypothetical protein